MPSPKKKKIVINDKVNQVLKEFFKGEIQFIKPKELDKLYDEGKIDTKMKKFLKKCKQEHSKEQAGVSSYRIVYELEHSSSIKVEKKEEKKEKKEEKKKKAKKIIINDELNNIIKVHFAGEISKISPKVLQTLLDDEVINEMDFKILKKCKQTYSKYNGEIDDKIEFQVSDKEKASLLDKFILEKEDGTQVLVDHLSPGSPPPLRDMIEEKEEVEGLEGEGEGEGLEGEGLEPEPWTDYADREPEDPDVTDYAIKAVKEQDKEKEEAEEEKEKEDKKDKKDKKEKIVTHYISQHRKAFVDFINEGFYKDILKQSKDDDNDDGELNVYQKLVKEYLNIDTPYRGLLVYHGLGTGKSASAISTAENLSKDLDIRTLLPASLEGEFIKEIKKWGKNELDLEGSKWTFIPYEKIENDGELRKKIKDDYHIGADTITRIYNKMKAEIKRRIKDGLVGVRPENEAKMIQQEFAKVQKDIIDLKGFWIHGEDGKLYKDLHEYQQIYLSEQVSQMILAKYNFIHYNPFPKVKNAKLEVFQGDEDEDPNDEEDLREFLEEDEIKEVSGRNKQIVDDLDKKLKYNVRNYNVQSPFRDEVIVIDEVHNFIRKILNDSGPSRTFYEWIINAENIKLVFLSGTPIINKPSEIAILYNMLKGLIKVYTFTIDSQQDTEVITEKLDDLYYKKKSPIELFNVTKQEGKTVISFTMNSNNFVSMRNPENDLIYTSKETEYTYKDFIETIFKGFEKVFTKEKIIPSKSEALDLKLTKEHTLDTELNIPYNRRQKLFEIFVNKQKIDLSNNEEFMDYFFEDSFEINDRKKTLLRRMLMGFTSYYPIDRGAISLMPSITPPKVSLDRYAEYEIVKNINVVPCPMSKLQYDKYADSWRNEKKKEMIRRTKRNLHEDVPSDFHIRTRQNCNIVFEDDEFRYERNDSLSSELKHKVFDKLLENKKLQYKNDLLTLSPKMYSILENINKFMDDKGKPTGKALIYSQFRGDAGLEAFELVLQSNGYSKFNPDEGLKDKRLRYTFITGQESDKERKTNKEAFNAEENKYGEYVQLMLISESGAEGISLTCVRQVHILEPYWNFVRIDQVFGRAIRLKSHDSLEPKDRTVEEYIYLSVLPSGSSVSDVYDSIKGWPDIPDIESKDLREKLSLNSNKEVKEIIETIFSIGETTDEGIFDIMERKFKVSQNIISVIKEASLDCIQHTRDEPELNDKCIRFSNLLKNEIAYFPGVSSEDLQIIDVKQFAATYHEFMTPDIHILADRGEDKFLYYQNKDQNVDIRYLRENSDIVCVLDVNEMNAYTFAPKGHELNDDLGNQFSVYQEIFDVSDYFEEISDKMFPTMSMIKRKGVQAYKIKYNMNEKLFYSPNEEDKLRRLYPYEEYMSSGWGLKALLLHKNNLYEEI